MRYSYSALVLATFTISQVVAGPVKHAHQHLHKKHNADVLDVKVQEKRNWEDVNFATVIITYSSGQTWGDATSAASAAAAATTSAKIAIAAVPTTTAAAAVVPTTTSTPAAAAKTSAAAVVAIASTETTVLTAAAKSRLSSMGAQVGKNSVSNNGQIWIGSDGPFTSEFINSSGEDLIIVCWGPVGSWVNAVTPLITHSVSAGSSFTLSFASGVSGACAAIYSDTSLVNGQVSQTWFEFTFGSISVFDVSREVNMAGHSLSLVGDICTSDMSTCVFKCSSGNVCTFGYELVNCTPGSQVGAEYGLSFGAPSGGCRLGSGTHVTATFS